MNDDQQKIAYSRIEAWHKAGHKGQGIKAVVRDMSYNKFNPNWFPNAKIVVPKGLESLIDPKEKFNHLAYQIGSGRIFADSIDEVHILDSNTTNTLQYVIDHDIDIYSHSTTGYWYNDLNNAQEEKILSMNNALFTAAGNKSDGGFIPLGDRDTWISIGAARLSEGKPVRENYSCYNENKPSVKTMFFTNYDLENGYSTGAGTSFSCPSLALGMYAVWRGAFKKIKGRKPTFEETLAFIKDNSEPMADPCKYSTGYGLLRMPEIESLYDDLEMWIGSKYAEKGNMPVELNIVPQLHSNFTMVGLRDIAELFGAKVVWSQKEKKITIAYQDSILILLVGNKIAKLNGANKGLNIAPIIEDNFTLVGIRDVSTLFGFNVHWNQIENKITIIKE